MFRNTRKGITGDTFGYRNRSIAQSGGHRSLCRGLINATDQSNRVYLGRLTGTGELARSHQEPGFDATLHGQTHSCSGVEFREQLPSNSPSRMGFSFVWRGLGFSVLNFRAILKTYH